MKKIWILTVLAMFCLSLSLAGQEAAPPSPEGSAERSKDNLQNAETLYPFTEYSRTYIDKRHYSLSFSRTEKIAAIVRKHCLPDAAGRAKYVKGENPSAFDEKEIIQNVQEEVAGNLKIKVSLSGKPLNLTQADARKMVREKVMEKYPESDEDLEKKYKKEAEKKFPTVKEGDIVTVRYVIGRKRFTYKGKFYGFGLGGKSIRINSRNISVRDLVDGEISKFRDKVSKGKRKNYVDGKLEEYRRQKVGCEIEEANKLFLEKIAENDKHGFIFYGVFDPGKLPAVLREKYNKGTLTAEERLRGCVNEWVSAGKVIHDMAKDMLKVTAQRVKYEREIEKVRLEELKKKQAEEAERKRQEEANRNANNAPPADGAPGGEGGAPGGEGAM